MDSKIHILQIGGGPLIMRGVEKYIQNINIGLDHKKFAMDVLTPNGCKNSILKNEIEKSGGKIIELKCIKFYIFKYISFCIKLNQYLKTNRYDIVEAQTGSIPIMALSTFIARKRNVKRIIVHTQNTHDKNWKYKMQSLLFKRFLEKADFFFSCSMKAGVDSFPESVHSMIEVIPNVIDVKKYQFNVIKRDELRKRLNIEDQFVVGHIGNFTKQKNHNYLIDVFFHIQQIRKQSILLLIGEGELQSEIEEKVKKMHLENKVIFYGISNEIPELLCCMDTFVFPSIWEGLGIVIIEAQASGLPCIYADSLPQEVKITDNCFPMNNERKPEEWAKKILQHSAGTNRESYNKIVNESCFSLENAIEKLEQVYAKE